MWRLELSDGEIESIRSLITEVAAEHKSVESAEFLNNACLYAHELPRRVRSFLNEFRLKEPKSGVCIISGYPLDLSAVGMTPIHWKWREDAQNSLHVADLSYTQRHFAWRPPWMGDATRRISRPRRIPDQRQ